MLTRLLERGAASATRVPLSVADPRRPVVLGLALMCTACSPPRFDITQAPPERTAEQQELDAIQCERKYQVYGPWLFGFGSAIIHSIRKAGYRGCMNNLGYAVAEKD